MRYYPHPIGFFIYILPESPETREDIFPVNPATCKKQKKIFYNFQKPQAAIIYIVEGHEKVRGLKESIPYISKMAIGNAGMECRNSKRVPPFSPAFSGKVKNQ